MEPALITAIVAGLATFGGGAWKLIDRADKKRERREAAVESLLTARVAALENEKQRQRRYNSRIKAAAGKWREQLIAHGIEPDPTDWPEDEHE
ncbi:hypothetical protein V1638_04275 [Pseudarthrobacter sp. J64]|uniref:hypothetical protein n=1 Tax=Pseudarthrobacter sp. J64 TaxID=3116485 RepID=UPI002E80CD39|nr:hypothetical protein [Pseudarthrobacter sp. J64]MEE2568613.1 hypothetical protein [Pseudarthrobacter sp. J64]